MTDVIIFTPRKQTFGTSSIANNGRHSYDPRMQNDRPAEDDRPTFTHLEVHSHYTLLGATASVSELVSRAEADGLSHLALTDTNVLYGAVTFDLACRAAGIQPLLGMVVTVAPEDDMAADLAGRLVLLATGSAGYQSLCRLSSLIQGGPDRQTIAARGVDWEALKAHNAGLICLSGGRLGWIERHLRAGNRPAASRYAGRLGGIYGENAYLSLEIHQDDDYAIAREVTAFGQRFGLPTVAVQPVYYLDPGEASRLRLLTAIERNRPLNDVAQDEISRHWLHPEDMGKRFVDFPEALARVGDVVARCESSVADSLTKAQSSVWIDLKSPGKNQDVQTAEEALVEEAECKLESIYGPDVSPQLQGRLQNELDAIARAGYATLFLIVADIVRFARQEAIPVSTRGSVANSLVAYCLGITTVDPISHDLLFERFLNPSRRNPPDIDLDFCSRRRDEVLDYVRRSYGAEQVALVATISTMGPKSAVRETAKALGFDEQGISQLSKRLPRGWRPGSRRGDNHSLAELLGELDDPRQRAVIRAAADIVGQPHHTSIHPGGVIITPGPVTDYVPVQWAPKGYLTTQFDYRDLEVLRLPKLDLLGIRALTVLSDAVELVQHHHAPDFNLEMIALDDELTGDMLQSGRTIGVFQCESAGAQRTLRQLRARTVADLAVANAFFKPGPATGGMAQTFIRRYRGEEEVRYLHPALEPILASTKGVLIFQEQILRVATEIAGLSWEQADHLRRGMSKFQGDEMAAMQAQFVSGCCRPDPDGPGFTPEQAETLWEQVIAFAGYGFNRGHATAYADVSYRSAYLKAHWPAAFLCARLAGYGGFHHPAVYIAEAVRLGIRIQPPHINYSKRAFTLAYPTDRPATLWMGLGQVRDLRRKSVQTIVDERSQQPFASLDDLMDRVRLQKKELIHLIQCGALDGLGSSRAEMLAEAAATRQAGSTRQMTFAFAVPQVSSESPAERLAWEHQLLGQPVSVHPLDLVDDHLIGTTALARLPDSNGRPVTVAGVRLPGWTGGSGFFLGDGQTFITVKGDKSLKTPKPWLPLRLRGRWRTDEWGSGWLQLEKLQEL